MTEIRKKAEIRAPKTKVHFNALADVIAGILDFGFPSGFGFRASDFAFARKLAPVITLIPLCLALVCHGGQPAIIIAVGAEGEEQFGKEFRESAELWQQAAQKGNARCVTIGLTGAGTNDLADLRDAIASEQTTSAAALWLVLLGHGTWDGKEAKFNLRGPDLSAPELASMLKPLTRPVAVVNAASCSAPFMKALAQSNRVVITATKSGAEVNYARFGKYISRAIASPEADLDKDGQTSLLEAFLFASRQVAEFYKTEGRLATEHALLDDTGDGLGTPADWFRGIRAVKTAAPGNAMDGLRAHQWHLVPSPDEQALTPGQKQQRDALELKISQLRSRKGEMTEDDYYREMEKLMLELSPFAAPERP